MRNQILKYFSFLFTLILLSCGGGGGDDGGGGGGGPVDPPPPTSKFLTTPSVPFSFMVRTVLEVASNDTSPFCEGVILDGGLSRLLSCSGNLRIVRDIIILFNYYVLEVFSVYQSHASSWVSKNIVTP